MSLAMTKPEREAFLADVHVAVISIPEPGRGRIWSVISAPSHAGISAPRWVTATSRGRGESSSRPRTCP